MINKKYLTCSSVTYYGLVDEELFFDWIKKITCIEDIKGSGWDLYLILAKDELNEDDLLEILSLFKRYKIDMKQLRPFLNDQNSQFLKEQKKAFWYKPLFQD